MIFFNNDTSMGQRKKKIWVTQRGRGMQLSMYYLSVVTLHQQIPQVRTSRSSLSEHARKTTSWHIKYNLTCLSTYSAQLNTFPLFLFRIKIACWLLPSLNLQWICWRWSFSTMTRAWDKEKKKSESPRGEGGCNFPCITLVLSHFISRYLKCARAGPLFLSMPAKQHHGSQLESTLLYLF